MNSNSIRAILFDFGGVLAEEGFRNGLLALAAEQQLDIEGMPKAGMHAVYDSGFVLGRGTAHDFWDLLRQRIGLTGADEELTNRILEGFILRPWVLDLVRRLREEGYITGILSDQTHWLDMLDERNHFSTAFDRIFNSYYLHKGKRDPTIFTDVAVALGVSPTAILFVDDDANNVARARNSGMQAIQYIEKEAFILELESVLQERG